MKVISILIAFIWSTLPMVGQTFNNRYHFDDYPASNGYSAEQSGDSLIFFSNHVDSLYKFGVHIVDLEGNVIDHKSYLDDSSWLFIGYSNTSDKFDGGYVTAGAKRFPEPNYRGKIVVWNDNLDTVVTKVFHATEGDSLIIFQQSKAISDGFVAVGSTRDGIGTENIILLETDFELNEIWRKSYGSATAPLAGYSVVQTPDGGFLLGGVRKIGESWDHCIIKTDTDGNQQYLKYHGNDFKAYYAHVANAADGNYYFGGRMQIGEDDNYSQICKIDQELDTIWCKVYGNHGPDCRVNSLKLLDDGNLIACGMDRSDFSMYGYVLKIDPDGNTIWYRKYTQTEGNWCFFYDVIQTSDGGYFLTGSLSPDSDLGLNQDIWGLKLDDMGCLVPGCDTLISVGENKLNTSFSVYPNPTTQFVNVYISSANAGSKIQFELTDLQGRLVKSFLPRLTEATYMLDVEELPAGVYLLNMTVDGVFVRNEKILKE